MRRLTGRWKLFVDVVCGLWGLLFLYMGLVHGIQPAYIVPVCFPVAIIITFSLYPLSKSRSPQTRPSVFDLIIMLTSIPICTYLFLQADNYFQLAIIWAPPKVWDVVCGVYLSLILLESGRRCVGKVLVGLVLFFFLYILLLSRFMPASWYHPGWDWQQLFSELVRDVGRGYSSKLPFLIISMVGVFMYLGPTLFATGLGKTFLDVSRWVGSKIDGGAAMVSVLGSALFGTMSGSATANVATTGAFTIPMMKSAGFKPSVAGAVEAAASTGGQLMPPIMGAVAFLMPEFISGITYFDVVKAALIPAILYFLLVGFSTFFYAKREGIGKLKGAMAVNVRDILHDWSGLLSIIFVMGVLLVLLFQRWPVIMCGSWALITGVVLHLLFGGSWKLDSVKKRFIDMIGGFVSGGKIVCWLLMLMALLQVIILTLEVTGLGLAISRAVLSIAGGGSLLLPALLVTMVACMIMGMGITTTAAYVIVVAVLAQPITKLLGEPLVAHMLIFYFCLLGCLTPPICAAVYPAAALAKASWLPVAGYACLLGLVGFIYPFFFAYGPQLLMIGSTSSIIIAAVTGCIGIFFFSSAIWGYLVRKTTLIQRLLMGSGGLGLMFPTIGTDLTGFGLVFFGVLIHSLKKYE